MNTEYLSNAQTAKLIRAALKRAFPGIKFSVTSSRGSAINVSWTDGPTDGLVDAVVQQFRGGAFDSSIDMAISNTSWLLPDGSATVASCPGTSGSMGYISPQREWMPVPGCRLVSFAAKYVFTRRSMSPAFAARVLARTQEKYGATSLVLKVSDYDGSASLYGDLDDERYAHRIASRLVILAAG